MSELISKCIDCNNIDFNKIDETDEELQKCSVDTPMFDFSNEVHLCVCVRVYDGDTVFVCFKHDGKYYQHRIRLYGLDSFELHPMRKIPKRVRNYIVKRAEKSKKRVEELILNKKIYLFCKEQDMYGRILGIIKMDINDEKSLNDMLVEEGHAYRYDGGTKDITQVEGIPKYVKNYFDKQK